MYAVETVVLLLKDWPGHIGFRHASIKIHRISEYFTGYIQINNTFWYIINILHKCLILLPVRRCILFVTSVGSVGSLWWVSVIGLAASVRPRRRLSYSFTVFLNLSLKRVSLGHCRTKANKILLLYSFVTHILRWLQLTCKAISDTVSIDIELGCVRD